jgi:hypothetical protein
MLKQVLEIYELLDSAKVAKTLPQSISSADVANVLKRERRAFADPKGD